MQIYVGTVSVVAVGECSTLGIYGHHRPRESCDMVLSTKQMILIMHTLQGLYNNNRLIPKLTQRYRGVLSTTAVDTQQSEVRR